MTSVGDVGGEPSCTSGSVTAGAMDGLYVLCVNCSKQLAPGVKN